MSRKKKRPCAYVASRKRSMKQWRSSRPIRNRKDKKTIGKGGGSLSEVGSIESAKQTWTNQRKAVSFIYYLLRLQKTTIRRVSEKTVRLLNFPIKKTSEIIKND